MLLAHAIYIYALFTPLLVYLLDILLYLSQAFFILCSRTYLRKPGKLLTFPLKKSAYTILMNFLKEKKSQHGKPLTF